MSLFIGSNAGDVITPDQVSSGVIAIGSKKPGAGADLILAGNGDDIVAGGGGDDLAFLGAGNDRYIWNSGDGSDIIDGGSGVDTLQVNGSSGSENLTLSARSGLAFVDRDIAHTTTTLGSVEHIEFHALAGADNITVKDLSAGGVTDVALDLAAIANGATGDGQADRVTIEGRQSADTITITKDLTGIHIAGTPENVSVTGVDSLDQIVVNGLGGNDTITASNGLGDTFHLTLDGGAGNDTLTGGDGADTLLGGDGNDLVNGGRGNDTALLGTGDDTFVWNPGDGSDIVEGQAGNDTLVFNGSNASETMDLSANGGRARLFRNVGNITMDINDVERVDIAALGGTDVITINDLTGTDVKQVHVDLNSDSAADLVAVNSTAGSDHIRISGSGTETIVSGLAAETHVDHAENIDTIAVHGLAGDDVFDVTPAKSEATLLLDGGAGQDTVTFNGSGANDTINLSALLNGVALSTNGNTISMQLTDVESMQVTGGAGDDTITAGNGLANLTHLTIDGGTGNDTLTGGDGADTLFGGDGNDLVNGGRGNDTALLGTGDDTFVWNPGDGSDIVEGQAGNDTLVFNGSNASETMDLSANGGRARLFRNVGNITMDINDVERVDIAALGGNDVITINDLTGTDVKQVHIDLNADAVADVVAVNATAGNDQVKLTGSGTETIVGGLAAETHVDHAETIDTIAVHTLAGNDTIDVTAAQSSGLLLLDGGEGVDTVTFNGSGANDTVSLLANGNGVTLINGGSSVAMQLTAVEDVVLTGGAGDDTIIAGNGLADAFHLTIDGGVGNDTLTGGDGADTLFGGDGNDLVNGGRGNDTALLGAGDDTFVWNPGDGSDIVEGQAGNDTLVFNGSNASETMDLSANGGRARLFRNVANITMDLNDVERVDIAALGGNDVITVNDLTGTDVKTVHIDLNADSVADVVAVNATAGNDQVHLSNAGTDTIVSGLFAETHVDHAETIDTVAVQTGAGNDTFDVSGMQSNATLLLDGGADTDTVTSSGNDDNDTISLFANGDGVSLTSDGNTVAMKLVGVESVLLAGAAGDDTIAAGNGLADSFHLTLDGGAGNDTLTGGDGADTLFGGDGNDLVNGGRGNDTALLGAGDDTFVWNPGDGSDTVEGQAGHDTLVFNGSNANETMDLSANGDRARLFRNVGNITMDVNGVERVDVSALAGADTLTVNDLTGTDVKEVHVNLTNDAVTDAVVVNATNGNDNVQLTGNAADTVINGLAAQTHVGNAEAIDTITVQTGAGDDHIDASAVLGGAKLVLNGGAGDDHITGSAGDDVLIGGAGNDVLIGGGGHDTFVDGEIVFGFDANLDQLDLRSVTAGHDIDWVLAHAHDIEGNVVFDFGDQHVTLMDQSVGSLHSGDFLI